MSELEFKPPESRSKLVDYTEKNLPDLSHIHNPYDRAIDEQE